MASEEELTEQWEEESESDEVIIKQSRIYYIM